MSETISGAALEALTDTELTDLYRTAADDSLAALVLREAARRERCERERASRHAVNEEWFLWAHAQFLAAEDETRGNLLNAEGRATGIDPWALWSGPAGRVERYASDELRDFWLVHPRITVMQYAAQVRLAERVESESAEA